MKTRWLPKNEAYDGTQLKPLRAYLEMGLLGDSIYAWKGSCRIPFEHMVDGEDLREGSAIEGSMMLHLIAEIFDQDLIAGVCLQRLIADQARALIEERTSKKILLRRSGDDLYLDDRKLSISIATRSTNSVLVHFALNVSNEGTPVPTCSLEDFGIEPEPFAVDLMEGVSKEWRSIREATWKVRPV